MANEDLKSVQGPRIVVGVDGSEASQAALAWAVSEARLRQATVHAVHAWHAPFEATASTLTVLPMSEDMNSWAEEVIDQTLAKMGGEAGDVPIVRQAEYGSAAPVLLDAAKGAAMLVVGSRGRRRMTGMLLGSVGQALVARASCPVVVIHAQGQADEGFEEAAASPSAVLSGTLEEIPEAECLALLASHGVGRLAVSADGQPLVFPVNYMLDGRTVAIRSDPGTKLDWASLGRVCFEIDHVDPVRHEGWSVLVQGVGQDITDGIDAWSQGVRSAPLAPWAGGDKAHWLAIASPQFSGRRLHHQPAGESSGENAGTET
jgi:nucleotide-binding universal stress UspA family protein